MQKGKVEGDQSFLITKKIRIYPKNEFLWFKALDTYRFAYNLTVEGLKNKEDIKGLREKIKFFIKGKYENDDEVNVYDVNLIYEAVRKCTTIYQNLIKKFKRDNKPFDLKFMSKKYSSKYFICLKLGKNGTIYSRQLGDVYYSEDIPEYSIGKNTVITYANGEWYAHCQNLVIPEDIKNGNLKICALDPGVRTFITSFSESQANIYGDNFAKDKLLPLALRISKLESKKAKLNKNPESYYKFSRIRYYEKLIMKARSKIKHLINDLHKRVAFDIVSENDIILLPTFEISNMIKKKDSKRSLHRRTIRQLVSLSHYKFKFYLKYLAFKYGKIVVDVNESYTSKTFNGNIINIGSKKTIKDKEYLFDRDINGARNILIRRLSKFSVKI